jgi:tetratricopeptide (TPR) repeat protein
LISNEELQILRNSIGQLISVNSFLSTSTNRQLALFFLESSMASDDLKRVLFEIDADPKLNNTKPFANITSFSYFPNEEEVLMMLGSIFRLVNIHSDDGRVWIIKMTLCSDNDHDLMPIFDKLKKRLEPGETSLYSFGQVLRGMGKFNAAEKGDYNSSLQWHQKALNLWMQILEPNDPTLGDSHNCITVVYRKKGDYKRAFESYEKALIIFRRKFGDDDVKIGMCFNNIGVVYYEDKNYSKALEYYEKALAIWQKHLPDNHSYLGAAYNNIGEVYRYLGQYDQALNNHHLSLGIYQKSLSPQHPDIATALENIGLVYEKKGDM